MLLNKRKKKKLGEKKKRKKEKKGKKRKRRQIKLFLGQINRQKDSCVGQWKSFEDPWGPRTPDWAQGPAGAWSGLDLIYFQFSILIPNQPGSCAPLLTQANSIRFGSRLTTKTSLPNRGSGALKSTWGRRKSVRTPQLHSKLCRWICFDSQFRRTDLIFCACSFEN